MADPIHGLNKDLEECLRRGVESWRKGRLDFLDKLRLNALLSHTNHLLYAAQGSKPWRFIRNALEAHFGQSTHSATGFLLESTQVVLATRVPPSRICWGNNGRLANELTAKSGAGGIDIQLERGGIQWIISCKNSKGTMNASSEESQNGNAQAYQSRVATGNLKVIKDPLLVEEPLLEELPEGENKERIAVLLTAYGQDPKPSKRTLENLRNPKPGKDGKLKLDIWLRLVGQSAWYFISGDYDFYLKLTAVLYDGADEYNRQLIRKLTQVALRLNREFCQRYVQDGRVDWQKVAEKYSGGTWKHAVLRYPKLKNVVRWFNSDTGAQWIQQHTTSTASKPPEENLQ
jgi:hypothetical protein